MTDLLFGVGGIVVLLLLLAIRTPVGVAMVVVGLIGITIVQNERAALATFSSASWTVLTKAELMVIPFFVLMGNLAGASGLSRNLFNAAYAWVGWMRGGLASATVLGCSGFAALSGSSVASAITMGQVALPEMKRFNYDDKLATGAVAAGGTLGILIPPSTGFVIYAILTEQSIGRLFLAGVVPGLLLAGLFVVAILLITARNPEAGPRGRAFSLGERVGALADALPFLGVVAFVIGGIYVGAFTPTEAAGVGAIATFVIALVRRSLTWSRMALLLRQTVSTTAMVYLIIIGASVFSPFLARTGLTDAITDGLIGLGFGPYGTLLLLIAAFIVLGTFLEGFAMLVLTVPIVFPIVVALGFDPIWFGVVMVIVIEMGLITPPVGINVFVVRSIVPEVPMGRMFRGILPFWAAMGVALAILILWPNLALHLPNTMFGV